MYRMAILFSIYIKIFCKRQDLDLVIKHSIYLRRVGENDRTRN